MNRVLNFITKKISGKIIFSLLILISFTSVAILFSTVVRVSNDNVKVTKDNLDMLSTSIFQNLRNVMNTGDSELIKKTEYDAKLIKGVENLEIVKSKPLIDLYSLNETFTADANILKSFRTKENQVIETDDEKGHFLRMIKPMQASAKCLTCHTNQEIGDVIGIIDLTFSLKNADTNLDNIIENIIITSIILGLITIIIIYFIVKRATMPIDGLRNGFERLLNSEESYKNLKLHVRSSDEIGEVTELSNEYMDKLHEDLLKDAKQFADSIVNSQQNIIISTNVDTKSLQTANKSFFDFFNVSTIDEFKEKFGECICETFQQNESGAYVQKMMDGEYWYSYVEKRPNQTHKVLIKKDDKDYIFTITTSHFKLGEVNYNASVLTDITELENIKNELVSLNNNLEQKVKEEVLKNTEQEQLLLKKEKFAALGEMMDAIAHQWKQPLNVIALQMQDLELDADLGENITGENVKRTSGMVHNQIDHLITTIDEFRKFFRPNQKKVVVNINNSLENIMKLMKDVLINNDIKVEINGDKDLEYELIETEFKHIFINLINNAKDAFVENDINNRKILFDIFKEGSILKITSTDNAGGIPENVIADIFKANVTTKEEGKGTGIGLYLVTQIIEKLNGKIYVENVAYQDENNETQNGARFIIELPID